MESPDSLQQKTPNSKQEVTATVLKDTDSDVKKRSSISLRRVLPMVAIGVVLSAGAIASGIYAYRWWQHTQMYPNTDNAYVTADIHPVTSSIAGIVTEVTVNDHQEVSPGKTLVKLDPRDYQVSVAEAKASLELAKQQVLLVQEKLSRDILPPIPPEPIPANRNLSEKNIELKPTIPQPLTVSQRRETDQQEYKTAQAAIAQKQAELKKAELQLSYTNITSLVGGRIGNKNVQVGQRVQPGQVLLTVVPQNPWVIANFKETQLAKIQPGQKAEIQITAFPNRKFLGKVDSVSPTSVRGFAPVSQENTTDNTLRSDDVQRIPVKVLFDPVSIKGYESRITPGMSGAVTVKTVADSSGNKP